MRAASTVRSSLAAILIAAGLSLAGCSATPLPTPPTARPARMSLTETQPLRVMLSGTSGAIDPGSSTLRISVPLASTAVTAVAADGSFSAELAAVRNDVFYLELLLPDEDLFLMAVTAAAPTGTDVIETDPGTDRDGDESPDLIDCAPDDPALHGRRCDPAMTCTPGPELCSNGVDDDCDGAIDEECAVACRADADCGGGVMLSCCGGLCTDVASDPTSCGTCGIVCGAGLSCVGGACTACGPAAMEICRNGVDDDCDGMTDEAACM